MKLTARAVTESVAAGLSVYLMRPADWPRWGRWSYVAGPALLVTAGGAVMTGLVGASQNVDTGASDTSEDGLRGRIMSLRSTPLPARIAIVAGAGGAMAAAQILSITVDTGIERWLSGRGVKHPRRLMGLAIGLVSLVESISTAGDGTRQSEVVGGDGETAPGEAIQT